MITEYKEDILESLTDGLWLMRPNSSLITVTQGFWDRLGREMPAQLVSEEQIKEFVFDGDLSLVEFLLEPKSNFSTTNSAIVRFLHADGRWVWFETKLKDLGAEAGERAFLFFDISSTKEREQIYNEFDSINNTGGWYVNMEDMRQFWTPFVFTIYGLEQGKLPDVADAINFYEEGESRTRIAELFNKSIEEGEAFDGEFKLIDAKGVAKWVRSRGKPVMKDGICKMVYGTIQDITADKEKELSVSHNRQRFEEVFNSTFQFCGILEGDGTMIEANETALNFAGLTAEDVRGNKFWDIHWWQSSQENQDRLKRSVVRAAMGEFVRYTTKVWDKDHNEVAIDFSLKPMNYDRSSAYHIIAEGRVIQDLVNAQKSVEGMISKVTRQNETLRNFAHIVSHNLRSHASNITLLTGVLENSVGQPLDEKVHGMLGQASTRLTETISHVSDVVAIHTSESEHYDEIDLSTAADESMTTVGAIIASAQARVTVDIPRGLKVKGVKAYIDSVFLNLITNAIKYRDQNRTSELSIKAAQSGNYVVLEFEDNGVGIDMKRHGAKLFGMYKTFHGNEDAKGIGLFITKNQIESMGGKIDVESEVNVGTKFKIKLLAI